MTKNSSARRQMISEGNLEYTKGTVMKLAYVLVNIIDYFILLSYLKYVKLFNLKTYSIVYYYFQWM